LKRGEGGRRRRRLAAGAGRVSWPARHVGANGGFARQARPIAWMTAAKRETAGGLPSPQPLPPCSSRRPHACCPSATVGPRRRVRAAGARAAPWQNLLDVRKDRRSRDSLQTAGAWV